MIYILPYILPLDNFIKNSELRNNWQGVIIYPNRRVESIEVSNYQELLNSERVSHFYLDEWKISC
ncbi:hypothetical protein CY0110_09535 [Crocosphaera chwakensis CCY0110]|uniref:Uncharacterized protein n=1 Tax=Crocosphaera chwakensis CCY0110 TaxID=391612 RepID=A3IYR1_9CHRO|nr:hypothetical protein CY0110_09535 [Crocosphaera chwakensis CCY0110]